MSRPLTLCKCAKIAANKGDTENLIRFIDEGAPVLRSAVQAAKSGRADTLESLLQNYDLGNQFDELFVAAAFSGDPEVVDVVLDYNPDEEVTPELASKFLIGAVGSGSKQLVDYALRNGATPSELVSYVLSPDSRHFNDILSSVRDDVDLENTYVATARSGSLDGLKRLEVMLSGPDTGVPEQVLDDALVSAVSGNNEEVVEYLMPRVKITPRLADRLTSAAALSGSNVISEDVSSRANREVLRTAALTALSKGQTRVFEQLERYTRRDDPVEAYAAYSGNTEVLDDISDVKDEYIALGAVRGGDTGLARKALSRSRPSKRFLEQLLVEATHSKDLETAEYALSYAKHHMDRDSYERSVNKALSAKSDEFLRGVSKFELTPGIVRVV